MQKIDAIKKILHYVFYNNQLPRTMDGLDENELLVLIAELGSNRTVIEGKITTRYGRTTTKEIGYAVDRDMAERNYGLKWPY